MEQVMQVTADDLKKVLRLKEQLPSGLYPILDSRDGATKLAAELPRRFTPESGLRPQSWTWGRTKLSRRKFGIFVPKP